MPLKPPPNVDKGRREMLQTMLVRLRDETYQRIRELRREQEEEAQTLPGDEMDAAKASADVETHAGLIAAAEEKLKYFDDALARLDEGKYGSCMECGRPIPVERLIAVPFALYCVQCERTRKRRGVQWSEGGTIPPYDQQWTPPEEMDEPAGREYRIDSADEELTTHYDRPLGPEEPVEPERSARRRRVRNGAKRKP